MTFLFNACTENYNSTDYLKNVLKNIDQIKSATYLERVEGWAPWDTAAYVIYHRIIKEYNNPLDSTIGASYVSLLSEDTTQMTFCYDGNMRAVVYEENKTIVIDSFNVRKLPFRPINPPFFNYTKSILKYALETEDSISIEFKDIKDTLHVILTIFDKKVEFFGKAHYYENSEYDFDETISKYELWINKSTDLPFKYRREMPHDISVKTCQNIELNKIDIKDFKASNYFQDDYTIQLYRLGGSNKSKNELIGKKAPDWTLQTADKLPISLTDLKSKVLMIQFTSVSCGPCKASIPFLKELPTDYKKEDFDFVSIESTSRNTNVLQNYMNRNDFEYKFLLSTKEVLKNYSIKSFPVFFILDENRVIKNVINGYGKETTDEEIRIIINDLI